MKRYEVVGRNKDLAWLELAKTSTFLGALLHKETRYFLKLGWQIRIVIKGRSK